MRRKAKRADTEQFLVRLKQTYTWVCDAIRLQVLEDRVAFKRATEMVYCLGGLRRRLEKLRGRGRPSLSGKGEEMSTALPPAHPKTGSTP